MNEIYGHIQYKGEDYKVALNLNVWQKLQEEYGTYNHWMEITTGAEVEPDIKAVIFGIKEMLNEGIDIDNEELGTNRPFFTEKQIGRLHFIFSLNQITFHTRQSGGRLKKLMLGVLGSGNIGFLFQKQRQTATTLKETTKRFWAECFALGAIDSNGTIRATFWTALKRNINY